VREEKGALLVVMGEDCAQAELLTRVSSSGVNLLTLETTISDVFSKQLKIWSFASNWWIRELRLRP